MIKAATKRTLLRTIAYTAAEAEETLTDAIMSLMVARSVEIKKGSGSKTLIASSRNGQSVSYNINTTGISDTELADFYSEVMDAIEYEVSVDPDITDANLVIAILATPEFTSISLYTRTFN